jgi:dTDP-4-dehydrorhamnose 3,5-epimerase
MKISPLEISGAWLLSSETFNDSRGSFREWYKKSNTKFGDFETDFNVAQANISVSKKSSVRGLHFSLAKEGQAKIVTCLAGSAFDVIADIRIGSPTFGTWISVELSSDNGNIVYLSSGLAHGVMALQNKTTIAYLLSSEFSPKKEHGIYPFDRTLNIKWPLKPEHISDKDTRALSLQSMQEKNLLPFFNE